MLSFVLVLLQFKSVITAWLDLSFLHCNDITLRSASLLGMDFIVCQWENRVYSSSETLFYLRNKRQLEVNCLRKFKSYSAIFRIVYLLI